MGGMQDKHQEPGKGREEQERPRRSDRESVQPGTGEKGARGKGPEELKQSRQDEMSRQRGEREMRDDEL